MDADEAKLITNRVARKHPKFRLIETRVHANGANITFAPIEVDPRTIAGWFEDMNVVVLYIGREWINNGFVMLMELRV